MLFAIFIHNERQFDAFHVNSERIYRLVAREVSPEGGVSFSVLHQVGLEESLKDMIPGVERAAAYIASRTGVKTQAGAVEAKVAFVSSHFFEIFSFPDVTGNSIQNPMSPNDVLICESLARKMFGRSVNLRKTIGRELVLGEGIFVIKGILADVPQSSSLQFDIVGGVDRSEKFGIKRDWGNATASMYVLLTEGRRSSEVEPSLIPFQEAELSARLSLFRQHRRIRMDGQGYVLGLQPLRNIYLGQPMGGSYALNSDPVYSYIFTSISVLVLMLA